jgi:hypothetical protein
MAIAKKSLTPKVKKPKEPTEADITKAIRDVLKACNIWVWKHWGGPMSLKGVPDLIGMIGPEGRAFYIEIKKKSGVVSREQQEFINSVTRHGGIAFVARSVDDVIAGLGLGDRFLDLK